MSARISTAWASETCSGAMYSAVPIGWPLPVISSPGVWVAWSNASPRSRILIVPLPVSIRFEGLMSRWTNPCSCTDCRPRAAWRTILAGVGDGQLAMAAAQVGQVHALGILHHQDRLAVDLAGVHGADDIGVIDPAHRLHLAIEAGLCHRVRGAVVWKDLQGDDLVQPHLPRLVHDPHAAFAEFCQQFILSQLPQVFRLLSFGLGRPGRRRGRLTRRNANGDGRQGLGPRYGLLAFRLLGIGVLVRRPADLRHERILAIAHGRDRFVALRALLDMLCEGLEPFGTNASQREISQFLRRRAIWTGHGQAPKVRAGNGVTVHGPCYSSRHTPCAVRLVSCPLERTAHGVCLLLSRP